nr:MAG TPA: methyltransferase [Caudoviricetes sp.]
MPIIEQIEKVYGIELSDYQKKNLISKLLNILRNN